MAEHTKDVRPVADTASLIERLRAYRGSEDAQVLMDEAADALAGLKAERDEEFYWKNEAMSRHAEAEAALARADSDRAALEAELAEMSKQYIELQNEAEEAHARIAALEAERETAREDAREFEAAWHGLARETKADNQKLSRAEADNQKLRAALEGIADTLREWQAGTLRDKARTALAAVEPERETDAVQEQRGQAGGAAPPLRPPP